MCWLHSILNLEPLTLILGVEQSGGFLNESSRAGLGTGKNEECQIKRSLGVLQVWPGCQINASLFRT